MSSSEPGELSSWLFTIHLSLPSWKVSEGLWRALRWRRSLRSTSLTVWTRNKGLCHLYQGPKATLSASLTIQLNSDTSSRLKVCWSSDIIPVAVGPPVALFVLLLLLLTLWRFGYPGCRLKASSVGTDLPAKHELSWTQACSLERGRSVGHFMIRLAVCTALSASPFD